MGSIVAVACGGAVGAFVQLVVQPAAVPAMGAIIGAVVFSTIPEIVHRVLADLDWRRSDVTANWSGKRRA